MSQKYLLYFDDTGSRDPDRITHQGRDDGMDCFGLGGFLVKEEDVSSVFAGHEAFCERWNIRYPLHSQRIRGGRNDFSWLRKNPEKAYEFHSQLNDFLLSLPIICLACIIDRRGYVSRYKDVHHKLWYMCKTAFTVLVERAAKFADEQGRKLEIYFEGTGKKEDRDITNYARELKKIGSPFNQATSGKYQPLLREDYARIILGEPHRRTKKLPLLQIADLILYPMAKGGYDQAYRPYQKLMMAGKLIDHWFSKEDRVARGIKYSCFPAQKE